MFECVVNERTHHPFNLLKEDDIKNNLKLSFELRKETYKKVDDQGHETPETDWVLTEDNKYKYHSENDIKNPTYELKTTFEVDDKKILFTQFSTDKDSNGIPVSGTGHIIDINRVTGTIKNDDTDYGLGYLVKTFREQNGECTRVSKNKI
jgi:hypothetical protein